MNGSELLKQAIPVCLASLPTFLACVIAIIVVIAQGQRLGGATIWALMGFGLAMVMSVASPLSQVWLRFYVIGHGMSLSQSAWMFGALGLGNSALHGAALIFLLVAALVGRSAAAAPPPFPQYR